MESQTYTRYCNIPQSMIQVIPIHKTLDSYIKSFQNQHKKLVSEITIHPAVFVKLLQEVEGLSVSFITHDPLRYKGIPLNVTTAQYTIIVE